MARRCTFAEASASPSTLSQRWNLCLSHLSHYAKTSSIAQRCHGHLQEIGHRLATNSVRQARNTQGTVTTFKPSDVPSVPKMLSRLDTDCAEGRDILPPNGALFNSHDRARHESQENPSSHDSQLEASLGNLDPVETSYLTQDSQFMDFIDGNFGELNSGDAMSSWPNLPYLAQFENGFQEYSVS